LAWRAAGEVGIIAAIVQGLLIGKLTRRFGEPAGEYRMF